MAGLVDEGGNFLEVYTYTGYGLPTITTFGDTPCTRGDVNGSATDFVTFRGYRPLRLRGDGRSTRDACDECGWFKSFAYADNQYVLSDDLDGRSLYQARAV